MGDKMDVLAGAGAGIFGYMIGLSLLQTVAVLLLTHAIYALVTAYMGWRDY